MRMLSFLKRQARRVVLASAAAAALVLAPVAQAQVTLPDSGVSVAEYAETALTSMGTDWGTIIGIGFAVLIVIILLAWAWSMLRGRARR